MSSIGFNLASRMRGTYSGFAALILIAMILPTIGHAQNGITVTEAKVYDDRTLVIMLDQLNEQLRNINFIDRTKLAAQLGLTQGFQSKEVSRSLDVGTLPIPGLTTKSTLSSSGELTVSEQTETRAAFSPTRPTLPELPAAPAFSPVFGENASDLLSDQVNLTYQIFNLRMILERSLSDRFDWSIGGGGAVTARPRLIAVIGIDVDLNPPKAARDYAAVVEIVITPLTPGKAAPALIALMPQEKTYNSVALNTKSTAFGGSAVAKIITIGYSERRRGETFYLFRDNDTSTISFPGNGENETKFGWIFRPVLGRRSVASEKRHMFAVLSFDDDDSFGLKNVVPVKVEARTHWRKYNRDGLTTNVEEKFGTDKYPIASTLNIPTTAATQELLKPSVSKLDFYMNGDDSAVVTVSGQNFFAGTSVIAGNSVYNNEANGLVLKSTQNLQLRVPLAAIATGDPILNGRYGDTVPLRINDVYSAANPEGVAINSFSFAPQPGRKFVTLSLKLQNRDASAGKDLAVASMPPAESLVVSVQGTALRQPYDLQDTSCNVPLIAGGSATKTCVLVQLLVPTDVLKKEALIAVRFPFRGPLWTDTLGYYEPSEVIEVLRVGTQTKADKTKVTTLAIAGRGFDALWKLRIDKVYDSSTSPRLEFVSDKLLTLEIDDSILAGYKNVIVLPHFGDPIMKTIPPAKPSAPVPSLDGSQPVPVAQNSSGDVEFRGKNLSVITKVTFAGRSLDFVTADDGTSIKVLLTPTVTKNKAPVTLLLLGGDSKITAKVLVQ